MNWIIVISIVACSLIVFLSCKWVYDKIELLGGEVKMLRSRDDEFQRTRWDLEGKIERLHEKTSTLNQKRVDDHDRLLSYLKLKLIKQEPEIKIVPIDDEKVTKRK